jgi:thiamine pyrophosphokinase
MAHYIIIAGGPINDRTIIKRYIRDDSVIICADGGAAHLDALDIFPHILVGDFDSITPEMLTHYKASGKVDICATPDQNSTDLQKALSRIPDTATSIDIFGALGGRMDHQFANILTLEKHPSPERFCIHDEQNHIRLLTKEFDLSGHKGDKIGIIPLRDVNTLRFEGLKYPAEGLGGPYSLGWLGTSNEMNGDKATIYMDSGLVIFTHYTAQ